MGWFLCKTNPIQNKLTQFCCNENVFRNDFMQGALPLISSDWIKKTFVAMTWKNRPVFYLYMCLPNLLFNLLILRITCTRKLANLLSNKAFPILAIEMIWFSHFLEHVGNWTGFAEQIHKNYKISCISSHMSLHRKNLITTNSNLKNKISLRLYCHMISRVRIYLQILL